MKFYEFLMFWAGILEFLSKNSRIPKAKSRIPRNSRLTSSLGFLDKF